MPISASIEGNELVIRLPIEERLKSPTGKTLRVASSHGNKETEAVIDGQKIVVGVNAYIYPVK